jgi:hypothetical protein
MGQKKSEFVSAFGIAFQVWKSLANAVLDRGGSDDDLRKIETDEGLRQKLADLIVGACQSVFPITTTGGKASALIAAGKYDWVNDWITDERFPIAPHAPETRVIELVAYDCAMTSGEVLADFAQRGLARPTYEDALQFGIEHPEEQRKRPIVFLHELVRSPDGSPSVLILRGDASERVLDLVWFEGDWYSHCLFAGVRR